MVFGWDAITPITPSGFTLAVRLHFMLSGHVAFPEQNFLLVACATEILAKQVEELAFVEPGKPTYRDCSP